MYDELLKRADFFVRITGQRIEHAVMPYIAQSAASVVELVEDQSAAIRSLQAKLDALKPRPIEEAPKDGSPLLAFLPEWNCQAVVFHMDGSWYSPVRMAGRMAVTQPENFIAISALAALEK